MPSSAPIRPDPTRERYETLLEVAESIAVQHNLSTLFEDVSRLLKRLVSFDFIALTLLDSKKKTVRLHILQSDSPVIAKPGTALPSAEHRQDWPSKRGNLIAYRT